MHKTTAKSFFESAVVSSVALALLLALSATAVSGETGPGAPRDRYSGKSLTLPNGANLDVPRVADAEGDFDCAQANVHCVPDEYRNLQAAADNARPGDIVLAKPGQHESFVIENSGSAGAPIRFIGRPGAIINRYRETEHGIEIRSDFTEDFYTDYIHIIGFTFDSPPGRCLDFTDAISTRPTRGHVISGNRCLRAAEHGFYLSQVSESYVAHNFIADSGDGAQLHGIYFSNGGTGNSVVYGNVIVAAENNGIHCNGDRSVDYLANGSRGGSRGTDGIVSGMIFDANIIVGSGQSGINLDGVQSALFANNVIHASHRHAIRGYVIDGSAGPADLFFVNNTLADNRSAIKLSDSVAGSEFVLLNNLFVRQQEDAVIIDAAYRERASLIANEIEFVNPVVARQISPELAAKVDYRLAPEHTRRVRDRGVPRMQQVIAPPVDLYGIRRDDKPDIGAAEHY